MGGGVDSDLGNGLDRCHSNAPGLTQGAVVQMGQHCSHQRFPQRLQVNQRHSKLDTRSSTAGKSRGDGQGMGLGWEDRQD